MTGLSSQNSAIAATAAMARLVPTWTTGVDTAAVHLDDRVAQPLLRLVRDYAGPPDGAAVGAQGARHASDPIATPRFAVFSSFSCNCDDPSTPSQNVSADMPRIT